MYFPHITPTKGREGYTLGALWGHKRRSGGWIR